MLTDLLDLNEILKLPELDWTIDELLPKGGLLIFGGTPKDGKSVIALDLVLKGIRNRTAFGKFQQRYNKALIVNVEGRHRGIRMRDMMFKDLTEDERTRILVSGKPLKFSLPNGQPSHLALDSIKNTIKEHKVELVVLDPLISFHAGDENNSQQMVAILDELRSIGEATNAAFLIIHHTRKPAQQTTLEMAIEQGPAALRGAGGIFGAVDCAVMLWPISDGKQRLVTFSTRYARVNTDPIEMQMDSISWRMYPIISGFPDPSEWVLDWGNNAWDRYALAFGLNNEQVTAARKLVVN